jgi:mannose-6-phosphate isomerase-like protein (cupin superfamily)
VHRTIILGPYDEGDRSARLTTSDIGRSHPQVVDEFSEQRTMRGSGSCAVWGAKSALHRASGRSRPWSGAVLPPHRSTCPAMMLEGEGTGGGSVEQQRADCYVLGSSEGRDVPQGLPGFKIRARDSGGLVSFFEFSLAAWESGPDLHLHVASDESFYVLSGVLEMQVGEQRHLLGAGEFAWVPRGMAHTFANAGPDAAHALTIATPGGIEDFFVEQSRYLASSAGDPDRAVLAEIRERHGGALLGPPIRARGAPRE